MSRSTRAGRRQPTLVAVLTLLTVGMIAWFLAIGPMRNRIHEWLVLRRLGSDDWQLREEAARQVTGSESTEVMTALLRCFRDTQRTGRSTPDLFSSAAAKFGRSGIAMVLGSLVGDLDKDAEKFARRAFRAVEETARADSVEYLNGHCTASKRIAAMRLGSAGPGEPTELDVVLGSIHDGETDYDILFLMIGQWVRVPKKVEHIAVLRDYLKSSDPLQRVAAVYLLGGTLGDLAVPDLMRVRETETDHRVFEVLFPHLVLIPELSQSQGESPEDGDDEPHEAAFPGIEDLPTIDEEGYEDEDSP